MAAANIEVCSLIWIISMAVCEKIPDAYVTCIVSKDCILPCPFKPAGSEVIQWYRDKTLIHGFNNGSDMLDQQDEHYRGRTFLCPEQLALGNASLLLRNSGIEDKGRYRCSVHSALGDQESAIIAKVEAPIQTIYIASSSGFKEVTCSSKDIYPAPQLLWSTAPSAPFGALKPTTRKTANAQGLYAVESMQKRLGKLSDFTYVCTLHSYYGTQTWTASLREREIFCASGKELAIPCLIPMKLQIFTLTWTFTRANKSEVILTFHSVNQEISNRWQNHTRVDPDQVLTGNGSLWLQSLENSGTYTCEFSAFQSHHIVHNHVGFTGVKAATEGGNQSKLWIIAVVIGAMALFITGMFVCSKQRDNRTQLSRTTEDALEIQHMRTDEREKKPQANQQLL
ncbi:hypothetical protein GJAV_G00136980 [Gymnothorax javanicus]|nr:hypothetical protein GJAV_G00136980 [Gymnothorax javanicus]